MPMPWDSTPVVSPDDMVVNIDSESFVYAVSTEGSIKVEGDIDGGSMVILVAKKGITADGKIDNNSNVTLKTGGSVAIGSQIDNGSQVTVEAGGDIVIGSYIHNATVDFKAHGGITIGEIDYGATVRVLADGGVQVTGKIAGNEIDHGPSRVDLVSNHGPVNVFGGIAGEGKVSVTANTDINIGLNVHLGDDRKIGDNSLVTAIAGGSISVGDSIKEQATVDLVARGGITIGSISGGATVRLLSASGPITVTDGISDSGTTVTYFPDNALHAMVSNGAVASPTPLPPLPPLLPWQPWTASPYALKPTLTWVSPAVDIKGYWWENYPQTFGYVAGSVPSVMAPSRVVPRSVNDISAAIMRLDGSESVKAVGGGYSFSDVALPFRTQRGVDRASTLQRGKWQQQDMRNVLEGLTGAQPMDLWPQAVGRNLDFSTNYDQTQLRQVTNSGVQLPATDQEKVLLIDTRSLASSLQDQFRDIQEVSAGGTPPLLFHVEAGITMADLQQLLDHQQPRMAILDSSAGPSGATLAGVLSTSTHGAAFRWPLLADTVKAVHLVGPGGEQWWIEGDMPVANQTKLHLRYPEIDQHHFIAKGWNGIPSLASQDVLNAVTVSMGTMGVIYSVVLEVAPQFGLRQVVHPTTWIDLLKAAGIQFFDLRPGDPGARFPLAEANRALLNVLLDGRLNGTGIAFDDTHRENVVARKDNVFAHVRINPFMRDGFNFDCWVINQEVTPSLPDDANDPSPDYLTALSRAIASKAADTVFNNPTFGRVFDFQSYATDVMPNLVDGLNDVNQAMRLWNFISGQGDVFSGTLATLSVQAVANQAANAGGQGHPDRGQPFLGDFVSGLFHALHGTEPGQNSDRTQLPYKFGAIGWPSRGVPGRAIEIALDPSNAFTFIQTVLFDDVLQKYMAQASQLKPLIGYIAVRVCQPTQALMGMQQYPKHSVMVEVAGYRSPEANQVMDYIQNQALKFSAPGPKPILHWGLENDQVYEAYLTGTPLGAPYKGTTRLEAFKAIRNYLRGANAPVFDNNFSRRMGL